MQPPLPLRSRRRIFADIGILIVVLLVSLAGLTGLFILAVRAVF